MELRRQAINNHPGLNLVRHSHVLLAGIQAAQIFRIPGKDMRE